MRIMVCVCGEISARFEERIVADATGFQEKVLLGKAEIRPVTSGFHSSPKFVLRGIGAAPEVLKKSSCPPIQRTGLSDWSAVPIEAVRRSASIIRSYSRNRLVFFNYARVHDGISRTLGRIRLGRNRGSGSQY